MSTISYQSKNYMPSLISGDWNLNNSVTNSDNTITISPNGYISCFINTLDNKSYSYFKTELDITCTDITLDSNFNSDISLMVSNYYYDDSHKISREQDFILGVNTYNVVDENIRRYKDTNELSCEQSVIAGVYILMFNGTNKEAKINNIGLFISQDVNKYQASDIYNSSISSNMASKLLFHLSRGNNVLGFSVYTGAGIKDFNFRFLNDRLSTVTTNFGYSLLVDYDYSADNIDHPTTE